MNKQLLTTSIIATLGVFLVYFHYKLALDNLYALIIMASLASSYIGSFTRYFTPISVLLSFLALAYPFLSLPSSLLPSFLIYFFIALGIGIIAIAIPWVWELVIFILLALFSFAHEASFLNVHFMHTYLNIISVLYLSLFSALGFADLSAAAGKGYPGLIKIEGLPKNSTWYAEVNGVFKAENRDLIKGKRVEITFCPQFISGYYFIPDTVNITVKEGRKKVVKFDKTDKIPPADKFPHCFAYFQCKGLPTNIQWSVIVNNVEYSAPASSIITVPLFNTKEGLWNAKEITIGNISFKPTLNNGAIKRGEKTIIEYVSFVQQTTQQQNTKPNLPPLDKWDPKIWIGKEMYGYKILSVIGTGGNGYVLKAEKDGSLYAIKVFSISPSSNVTISMTSNFDLIFKESETLKNLSTNPKFVRIYGIYIDSNNLRSVLKGNAEVYYNYPPAIIMEYMMGGTSLNLAESQIAYSTQWPLIVKEIIKEVAEALAFLHSNSFVHLDVKPENIFFSRDLGKYPEEVYRNIMGSVKLGDLGSSVRIGEKITQATPGYCPPEQIEAIILGKGANPKMDIFALGMTAYTLLILKKDNPISNILNMTIDSYLSGNVSEAMKSIQQAKQVLSSWRPILPQNTPQDLANMIIRSLSLNPEYRPTAEEIVRGLN